MTRPQNSTLARAKINLTLRVLGRRPDGYHEIASLVAFADIGDRLVMQWRDGAEAPRRYSSGDIAEPPPTHTSSRPATLRAVGPFAAAIVGDNLVETAIRRVEAAAGGAIEADFVLEKNLPVASGIGGGSADAAAALRLMREAYGALAGRIDWDGIARGLGADVPVCLASRSAMMRGTGELISPICLPKLDIVLANACEPVPADKTRQVFSTLGAPPSVTVEPQEIPRSVDRERLLALMRATGNDLEAPARSILASLGGVKAAVAATAGCEIAIVSGAGPTIVGIYPSPDAACRARDDLQNMHPGWWVQAGTLGGD